MRPLYTWKLRSRSFGLGARTLIMGVVNVTPDSFSDAGQHFDHRKAIEHGLHMLDSGADLIDLGGESTRPGVEVAERTAVPEPEELRRVVPVLEGILRARPQAIVSVDTYKAGVARVALDIGAGIAKERLALDPGFGFGKMGGENYSLLAHFGALHELGYPLLTGVSRKGFIGATLAASGKATDCPPPERLYGTLAAVTACILG